MVAPSKPFNNGEKEKIKFSLICCTLLVNSNLSLHLSKIQCDRGLTRGMEGVFKVLLEFEFE